MKVPKSVAGCRFDGFDVAAWVDQGLVDLIVPGCRSLDVDVQGFVELTGGRDVPVYPCLDDHHGTDAYLNPGPELFRGVFVNWLSQGAAGTAGRWPGAAASRASPRHRSRSDRTHYYITVANGNSFCTYVLLAMAISRSQRLSDRYPSVRLPIILPDTSSKRS